MATANDVERARRDGVLLGLPLGDLGWFASLLMGAATGMTAFFLATFVTILGMLIYQAFSGHVPAYELSYRRVGFPVGLVVLVAALSYLGVNWARRMARKRRSA